MTPECVHEWCGNAAENFEPGEEPEFDASGMCYECWELGPGGRETQDYYFNYWLDHGRVHNDLRMELEGDYD